MKVQNFRYIVSIESRKLARTRFFFTFSSHTKYAKRENIVFSLFFIYTYEHQSQIDIKK